MAIAGRVGILCACAGLLASACADDSGGDAGTNQPEGSDGHPLRRAALFDVEPSSPLRFDPEQRAVRGPNAACRPFQGRAA